MAAINQADGIDRRVVLASEAAQPKRLAHV
jgi:hypothetical protein